MTMVIRLLSGAVSLTILATGLASRPNAIPSAVQDCASLTGALPGHGMPNHGRVRIDPYHVTVTVPKGLTGWGSAPDAPFHGFVIFLRGDPQGCIVFELTWRFQVGHPVRTFGASAQRIDIGNRDGWKEETNGTIAGVEWTNVIVGFSLRTPFPRVDRPDNQEIEDGSVTLATPTRLLNTNQKALDEFLSYFRFDGSVTPAIR